jgi:hypothetical protein
MELRQTEEKVNELIAIYERARNASLDHPDQGKISLLPAIGEQTDTPATRNPVSIAEVLSQLQTIQTSIEELQSKMSRFRKRLAEKDPVTGNPRYGANAAARVGTLLGKYDQLVQAMALLDDSSVVQDLQQTVAEIEAEKRNHLEEEQRRKLEAEEALCKEQEDQQRQMQQQLDEEEQTRRHELLELNRRAHESRQHRHQASEEERRVREERQRRDHEWMAGITKSPDGVTQELAKLREATKNDAEARMTAVAALHTLFSQIVSHPEEANFRRVRRDHLKFQSDIGRHDGGQEVLIAAGFRLGAIDDVPCFISTEPNIENDMDGWSEWFNLLKAALDIIEQELLK